MYPTVGQIAEAIDSWAPEASALSYDNVGLQVGRRTDQVRKVLLALDVTREVVDEAIRNNFDLVLSHHPLIFKPLKRVTSDSASGSLVLALVSAGINLYTAHTNFDLVHGGVSYALAQKLGLSSVAPLQPVGADTVKLVTFVPESHSEQVREALGQAGAGRIGAYDSCAFESGGMGYFRANDGANPYIGVADGSLQSMPEVRLEVRTSKHVLPTLLRALKAAHPYDEIAYDVYPLLAKDGDFGLGAIGSLSRDLSGHEFLEMVRSSLGSPALRFSGNPDLRVEKVAVCGGSGADLIADAKRSGADAFVTGDVKYHSFFEAFGATGEAEILVVDAGHFETEAPAMSHIIENLRQAFTDVEWQVANAQSSPVQGYPT